MALWREALLARAVLRGRTRGYRHHPQLARFREHPAPRAAISTYLAAVHAEALRRGYSFDHRKIGPARSGAPIEVTRGQLAHEWEHLLQKLSLRDPPLYQRWRSLTFPRCHPLMRRCAGPLEKWELPRSGGTVFAPALPWR